MENAKILGPRPVRKNVVERELSLNQVVICSLERPQGASPMTATSVTFEASVGLNNKLPGFFAQQYCVPEG